MFELSLVLAYLVRPHVALMNDATVPLFEQLVDRIVGAEYVVDYILGAVLSQLLLNLVIEGESLVSFTRGGAFTPGVAEIQDAFSLTDFPEFALREGRWQVL